MTHRSMPIGIASGVGAGVLPVPPGKTTKEVHRE